MVTISPELTTLQRENYLNSEHGLKSWLLTQDHKRIALLYLISTTFFFVIGGTMAALIRLNLLTPSGELMAADTYNKVFSIHGIIMVFFFLVPIAPAVLGNFLIPLMIGARDVAFPRINLLSWYLFVIGGCFELYMMIFGGVDTGWTFTTPLSTHFVNTHVIGAAMGIFIAGFSSILTGAELHRHHPQVACPRNDLVPAAVIHLVLLRDVDHLCSCHAGDRHIHGANCARTHDRHWRI